MEIALSGLGVVGLQIDMDEISGKGKYMFMLTAIGTAVIIEKEVVGLFISGHPLDQYQLEIDSFTNATLTALNDLEVKTADIENAYLTAPVSEKRSGVS